MCFGFLAVLSRSAAQHETLPNNCSSQTQILENISTDLKVN